VRVTSDAVRAPDHGDAAVPIARREIENFISGTSPGLAA
jgi:hypothetical protein